MDALNLTAPKSWSELSQSQLDFLLVYCLFRWNGVKVITPYADGWLVAHDGRELVISSVDVAAATAFLSWTAELPSEPVRLDRVDGADAVEASLGDDFSFDDWLSCEALWQGYQVVKNSEFLRQMAEILYRKPGISLKEHESVGIFYWWAGLKSECNRLYPNFLQPAEPGTAVEPTQDMIRRNMDAQIRALTKGDITKEELILAMPAHRALTELDALAREYDELNRKYPTK